MWAVWSKSDRRKEGDSLELLSLSLLDVRHSARAQRSKWNTISSTMPPQSNPRHYLWNNWATEEKKKFVFFAQFLYIRHWKEKKKAEVSSGCSSHALTILEEVVLGASNSKIKCFLRAFPKCPANPRLMCLERRAMEDLVNEDMKNKSSVRRRQQTDPEQVEPRWWRMSPTSVWPYLTKLCSTLIVMTHWASVTLTHPPLGVHILYVLWILSGWCEHAHRSPTGPSPKKAPKSTLSVC